MIAFCKERTGFVGVEQECFITWDGMIVPHAPLLIPRLTLAGVGYELSACQLEHRTRPVRIDELERELEQNEAALSAFDRESGYRRLYQDVAPQGMSLEVYPDQRYKRIVAGLAPERLDAACRIAGTHVHIGMPSLEAALSAYNAAVTACPRLCQLGDLSGGERLKLYQVVVANCLPPYYRNMAEYLGSEAFQDPRSCWHLVRISRHGTLEFRPFSACREPAIIVQWAQACLELCLPFI